jgi:hypothetical protein
MAVIGSAYCMRSGPILICIPMFSGCNSGTVHSVVIVTAICCIQTTNNILVDTIKTCVVGVLHCRVQKDYSRGYNTIVLNVL